MITQDEANQTAQHVDATAGNSKNLVDSDDMSIPRQEGASNLLDGQFDSLFKLSPLIKTGFCQDPIYHLAIFNYFVIATTLRI